MTVRKIEITCDTPDCDAMCSITAGTPETARSRAAEHYGWMRRYDGADICAPCTRGDTPQTRGDRP